MATDIERAHRAASRGMTLDGIVLGWMDFATWLTDDILMAVGWFHLPEGTASDVFLVRGESGAQLDAQVRSYARPDIDDDPRAGKVLVVRVPDPPRAGEALGTLVIQSEAATVALGPADLSAALTDLPTLLRGSIAGLAAADRADILALLSALPTTYDVGKDTRLSKSLATISEVLRERLPYSDISVEQPVGLFIDDLLAVDERAYYLKGWLRTGDGRVPRLVAVSPEGARIALPADIHRFARRDVDQFYGDDAGDAATANKGFACYFESPVPSYARTGWMIELHCADGTAVETAAPPVVRESAAARETLFADIAYGADPFRSLVPSHIYPALERMQARHHARSAAGTVEEFGAPCASPTASIVVPLYRRIDFVEHQLAQFVHDPDFARADLIYVLDSPELAGALRRMAAELYQLYRVPYRVMLLERNLGFSGANNAGAAIARSDLLLFMNSDVLPARPGWLMTMAAAYRTTPDIGAMGPKLLYEDDSIQHAGMYFGLPFGATVWQNMHYYKGMHRSLPAANISRAVPAVTGACLMVERARYEAVGRLSGTYVQGDYEDSDLCLRLIEAGYRNWYCAEAELYHLEAQSYEPASRAALTQYNGWVHTHLWRDRIADVMEQYPQW